MRSVPLRKIAVTATLVAAAIFAAPAHAADIRELRTILGITIGKFDTARPPASMTSMPTGFPCRCPDFCRLDLANAGSGTSISVRWDSHGTECGANLITVQSTSGELAGVDAPNIAPLYGKSPDEIIARYGKPSGTRGVTEGQFVYCELLDDGPGGSALTGDLLYFGFQFSTGRLTAIRVGSGQVCPDYPFIPVP